MSIRKMLPVVMVALALLAASAAFAADAPPASMSQEDFLSSLQIPSDQEGMALPEVDGVPSPQMMHASGPCAYLGIQCRTCTTGGYEACETYRCPYGGTTHYHRYCSGFCSNPCSI
jgi:hypothetical protein